MNGSVKNKIALVKKIEVEMIRLNTGYSRKTLLNMSVNQLESMLLSLNSVKSKRSHV